MNWNDYFLDIAEVVKEKSKDPSTKIGAVIVGKDNEILSTGYNSFPRGLNDNVPERKERPEKYEWIEHAERNAIYNAAKNGIKLDGSKIFLSSGIACMDCARAIINSGIKEIHCKKVCTTKNRAKWEKNQLKSVEMLKECGITIVYYD